MAKATGTRGSWFATVNGQRLPCVHEYYIKDKVHRAPRVYMTDPKSAELVDAIKALKKVIVTEDKGDGHGWERKGYVGVFAADNVKLIDDVLCFDVGEKLLDLS